VTTDAQREAVARKLCEQADNNWSWPGNAEFFLAQADEIIAAYEAAAIPKQSVFEMTVAELQAELGRVHAALQAKVLGDPRERVTISTAPFSILPADLALAEIGREVRFCQSDEGASVVTVSDNWYDVRQSPAEVLALLSALAPAVEVTDAMIERAVAAYWADSGHTTDGIRAALIAALRPEDAL